MGEYLLRTGGSGGELSKRQTRLARAGQSFLFLSLLPIFFFFFLRFRSWIRCWLWKEKPLSVFENLWIGFGRIFHWMAVSFVFVFMFLLIYLLIYFVVVFRADYGLFWSLVRSGFEKVESFMGFFSVFFFFYKIPLGFYSCMWSFAGLFEWKMGEFCLGFVIVWTVCPFRCFLF